MSISYGELAVISNMTTEELKQELEDQEDTISAIQTELERREDNQKEL